MKDNIKNFYEQPFNLMDKIDNKPLTLYKGHVVIVDDISGETILEKDNLVVLRGRSFALEKMFDKENSKFDTNNLNNKTICLWGAGDGGCVTGEPFTVLSVNPADNSLGRAIPFMATLDGETRPEHYYNAHTSAVEDKFDNAYTYYYAKDFDSMEWINDEDEVALKLTLKITEDDFKTELAYDENDHVFFKRNTFINEIGLYIANTSSDDKINLELATRLTFESEPYFNTNAIKSSTLYYYIYA